MCTCPRLGRWCCALCCEVKSSKTFRGPLQSLQATTLLLLPLPTCFVPCLMVPDANDLLHPDLWSEYSFMVPYIGLDSLSVKVSESNAQ